MASDVSPRMRFPDALRAIAAMVVILPHSVGLFTYFHAPSLLTRCVLRASTFGPKGVQIFFVLSGFVIAYTLRGQKLSARYIGRFILRRSIRLDPPYWAAIVLYLGYIAFRQHVGHTPEPYPSGRQLLAHLFYLQDILGYGNINIVFWTLCIEIQFYLVFCLLIWLVQSFWSSTGIDASLQGIPLLGFFALALAWPANLLHGGIFPGSFLPHWYAFLAGAIVWWTVGGTLPRWAGYAAIAALWVVVATAFNYEPLTVALTATSLVAASFRGNLYHWLDIPPFQFLGRISYCLYLVHRPVAQLMMGGLYRYKPRHELTAYLLFAAVVFVTIGVAYAMHRLVEVPALRWSKLVKVKREVKEAPPRISLSPSPAPSPPRPALVHEGT